jgi:hypothetical protein
MTDILRHGKPESAPAHGPRLCGLDDPGPRSLCPGRRSLPPPDPGDQLLDHTSLLSLGLGRALARAVLGPHSALSRHEIEDRLAMLRRERDPMQAAKDMLARALPAYTRITGTGGRR